MRWPCGRASVVVWLGLASSLAHADAPLDKPAFTAKPAELLAVAKLATAGGDVVILRRDVVLAYDAAGRISERWRLVFAVRTPDGAKNWAAVSKTWRPFHQERPAVRARVIAPDGTVATLDPSKVTDAPVVATSTAAGERRELEAPLPPLQVGSVVEEEITARDRELLTVGGVGHYELGDTVPTLSAKISLSAPASRKLHVATRNLPAGSHQVTAGVETWSYNVALPATPEREPNAPFDVTPAVELWVSPAPSWAAVARDLRATVDRQIAAAPVALAADLPTTPSIETARAIARWVHRKVSYNTIGLDEIRPRPETPAATLKAGSADDLAKATLLVSLLRQAKISADLALVTVGPGADVPDVPGLGEFDRAIVRARIGGDVWIDPTDDLSAVGQVPVALQGRRALVIADDTTALISLPRSSAADTLVREVRTFDLVEYGNARVTDVTRTTGALASSARGWVRDSDPDELRDALGGDAKDIYLGELESYRSTPPDDLATPFELTMVTRQSRRGHAGRERIHVYLFPSAAANQFSDNFKRTEVVDRHSDYIWWIPHRHEIENRLVIPDGFTIPTPAPDSVRTFGSVTLTQSQRVEGRTLVVTFRIDTGASRITPAAVRGIAEGIKTLDDELVDIAIEQTGMSLAYANKYKEGIAELQRLSKAHPKEALHHEQLATVYTFAGMGAAARREATLATQLEPKNADAFVVLGWVLRHDTLGRDFGFDQDRRGALAAYAKARVLDPTHLGAWTDSATLLENSPDGRRYDRGADLPGTVELWKTAATLDASHSIDLLRAMVYAEQYKAAEAVAVAMPASADRDPLLIAALAGGTGGAPAAIAKAPSLAPKTPDDLLDQAAWILAGARAYSTANALWAHTGKLSSMAFGDMLRRIQRYDLKPDPSDPRAAFGSAVHWLADLRAPRDALWDDRVASQWVEDHGKLKTAIAQLSHAYLEDLMHVVDMQVETGPGGSARLTTNLFGKSDSVYFLRDRKVAKLIGWGRFPDPVGDHVLRLLARNDQATAFQLLDWLVKDIAPTATFGRLIGRLWSNSRTKDTARLVGALLAGARNEASIAAFRECNTTDPDVQKVCAGLLGPALAAHDRQKELDAHLKAQLAADPNDLTAKQMQITAAIRGHRYAEAHTLIDAWLAAHPGDDFGTEQRARVFTLQGKLTDALPLLDTLTQQWGTREPDPFNDAAWLRLVLGRELDKARDQAKRAVALSSGAKPRASYQHTLACLDAELGDVDGTTSDLALELETKRLIAPGRDEWYIVGRLAEQLGLRADAIDAYRKVTPPAKTMAAPDIDVYALAQRRLKGLKP